MMTLEQLDTVSGGYFAETYFETFKLYEYGFLEKLYTPKEIADFSNTKQSWAQVDKLIRKAWRKIGIEFVHNPSSDNDYFMVNGDNVTQISREKAHRYLENNFPIVHNI